MTGRETADQIDASFAETLGRTIRVLRTDRAMSRTALADRAGISYSYLSAIENGTKPPSTKIQMILAEVLGLRHHELLAAAEARRERGEGIANRVVSSDPDALAEAAESFESWAASGQARFGAAPMGGLVRSRGRQGGRSPAHEALLELAELVPEMDDDDLAFLVEMARRLSGR